MNEVTGYVVHNIEEACADQGFKMGTTGANTIHVVARCLILISNTKIKGTCHVANGFDSLFAWFTIINASGDERHNEFEHLQTHHAVARVEEVGLDDLD